MAYNRNYINFKKSEMEDLLLQKKLNGILQEELRNANDEKDQLYKALRSVDMQCDKLMVSASW